MTRMLIESAVITAMGIKFIMVLFLIVRGCRNA